MSTTPLAIISGGAKVKIFIYLNWGDSHLHLNEIILRYAEVFGRELLKVLAYP